LQSLEGRRVELPKALKNISRESERGTEELSVLSW